MPDNGLASAQWGYDTQEGPEPFENESEEENEYISKDF